MTKRLFFAFLLALLMTFASCFVLSGADALAAERTEAEAPEASGFVLPAALQYMAEDAFEGTPLAPTVKPEQSAKHTEVQLMTDPVEEDQYVFLGFVLPLSLERIEDEAFEGTGAAHVDLPESVAEIGERAFADMPRLKLVRIPKAFVAIASNAFAGSTGTVLTGAPSGFARAYAQENGLPFVQGVAVAADASATHAPGDVGHPDRGPSVLLTATDAGLDSTPKWRPVREILSEQYHQCIAHHVQGRSPPFVG